MLDVFLRLSLCPGIGSVTGKKILSRLARPGDLFTLPPADAAHALSLPKATILKLRDARYARQADREMTEARKRGIQLIPLGSPAYPDVLQHIYDPPLVLRVLGTLQREDQVSLAVVGARRPSAYGRRQAIHFTRALAAMGVTIVSGLARGIDSLAHAEALAVQGRTLAILGSGLARIYPPEHRNLAGAIAENGAVLSELPLTAPPLSHNFPKRNRIISGLTLGTLVIEGGLKSGTMITARLSLNQGRTVFAVPGPIDRPTSQGTNALISQGAVPATGVDVIFHELGSLAPLLADPKKPEALPALTADEKRILDGLAPGVVTPEMAARATGLPVPAILSGFTSLELKGRLRRSGNAIEKL